MPAPARCARRRGWAWHRRWRCWPRSRSSRRRRRRATRCKERLMAAAAIAAADRDCRACADSAARTPVAPVGAMAVAGAMAQRADRRQAAWRRRHTGAGWRAACGGLVRQYRASPAARRCRSWEASSCWLVAIGIAFGSGVFGGWGGGSKPTRTPTATKNRHVDADA